MEHTINILNLNFMNQNLVIFWYNSDRASYKNVKNS